MMVICEHLQTERLTNACGLVVAQPEFTWKLQGQANSVARWQWEIQVQVIDAAGDARPIWQDQGQHESAVFGVRYAGPALRSRERYQWRVRVSQGESVSGLWSAWAGFEMGVLAPDRIDAAWIAGGGAFRRTLTIKPRLLRARAYVSGLGLYEFWCNARQVSVAAMAPSFTEFDRRVEYEVIDLTAALHEGANQIQFLAADGWWRHGPDTRSRKLQVIGQIVLEYADGQRESIATESTWLTHPGPIVHDPSGDVKLQQIFDGVALDMAWLADAGASAQGWQPAIVLADGGGAGELVPALLPPMRTTQLLEPRDVRHNAGDQITLVDFGQNFTGWVRARARGSRGQPVVMRHTELLDERGQLNPSTLRSARQTDTFILTGNPAGEIVEPRMLYHGFRHAEISGAAVDADSIRGVVVHSDLPVASEISTSDSRINWLLSALQWTVRSNAMSVMTDVSQRDERRGWLMDGLTALKTGVLFYDMNSLGRKWLTDILDNQTEDGSLRGDCAPIWGPCRSIGWQRAIVLLPMVLWRTYGDRATLERGLPGMQRYAECLVSNLVNDVIPAGFSKHPAEWLCIGRRHDELADNALAIDVLRQVAMACRVLGSGDSQRYDSCADRIAAAAHQRWFDETSACYNGGEGFAQSSQVYALRFGITPASQRQRVFDRLLDDLMNARGDGPFVTTGIGSTEHLPFVLSEFGRDDLVWQWLQRDAYPGYGFMQRHGATAIWERWERMEYHQMNAHNHAGLTGIGVWLRERLLGLQLSTGTSGQPAIRIAPACQLPIEKLQARWRTRWGEIHLAWSRSASRVNLQVRIPTGTRATLALPGQAAQVLNGGDHACVWEA